MKTQALRAPEGLGSAGATLWRDVTAKYVIEPHHRQLLLQACRAADTAEQAQEQIAREGLTISDTRGGIRAHPLLAVQRDAQRALGFLFRVLGVRDEEPRRPGRPGRD